MFIQGGRIYLLFEYIAVHCELEKSDFAFAVSPNTRQRFTAGNGSYIVLALSEHVHDVLSLMCYGSVMG